MLNLEQQRNASKLRGKYCSKDRRKFDWRIITRTMIDRGKEFSISYPLISSLLSFRKAEQIRMKEWAPCCWIEVKVSVIPRQNLLYFRVDGSRPTTRTQPRQDFLCACVILLISALTLLWPRAASGLWNFEMACVKSKRMYGSRTGAPNEDIVQNHLT